MNREIEFRGFDSTKWYYGDLEYNRKTGVARIHTYEEDGSYSHQYTVDPDTVGQFTGLLDKNGKKIFEGDIVVFYTEEPYCINPDCESHLLGYDSCIHKETSVVKFADCAFGVDGKYGLVPLSYCGFHEEEIEELKKKEFEDVYFQTNGYEIGNSIIGIEIIGNIYDNPELLNEK